jgi:hypothetical protein
MLVRRITHSRRNAMKSRRELKKRLDKVLAKVIALFRRDLRRARK